MVAVRVKPFVDASFKAILGYLDLAIPLGDRLRRAWCSVKQSRIGIERYVDEIPKSKIRLSLMALA